MVTVGVSGRTVMEALIGSAEESGMTHRPRPAATSAMAVEVSVASWTMRGRKPARRLISATAEATTEVLG